MAPAYNPVPKGVDIKTYIGLDHVAMILYVKSESGFKD